MISWGYFDKFAKVINKYMPDCGEGETMASQIVTAVNKLIYKWYNDGDVFDNTHHMDGWCNDLSSYANWLAKYTNKADKILREIKDCYSDGDYEILLKKLADNLLVESYLDKMNMFKKTDSIYNCIGEYEFVEN